MHGKRDIWRAREGERKERAGHSRVRVRIESKRGRREAARCGPETDRQRDRERARKRACERERLSERERLRMDAVEILYSSNMSPRQQLAHNIIGRDDTRSAFWTKQGLNCQRKLCARRIRTWARHRRAARPDCVSSRTRIDRGKFARACERALSRALALSRARALSPPPCLPASLPLSLPLSSKAGLHPFASTH